ncbi:MAG TPA: hypothetical protein ENI56_00095 [Candidatus Kaiserbacteria bacterium]|nr:hypothetical protein [Candidatus Kaiserbacteria bacterium]
MAMYNLSFPGWDVVFVSIIVFAALTVAIFHLTGHFSHRDGGGEIAKVLFFLGSLAIVTLIIISVGWGYQFGKGSVVATPLPYAQQLNTFAGGEDNDYIVIAESRSGKDRILFLRSGDGVFHTIRVKGKLPPTHFRLVNEKPVSVTTVAGK